MASELPSIPLDVVFYYHVKMSCYVAINFWLKYKNGSNGIQVKVDHSFWVL